MLYVAGVVDVNEIETVAGVMVLGHVAKTAAEYDTNIIVPTARSLVMTSAKETVEAAYASAGRSDAFDDASVYYVTDDQFGYVAHVCGRMNRDKPSACFYLGKFYAESLLLAESGNSVGAIQIAGTAEPAQLPFFVAACDYTLLGEELFAASAYLSRRATPAGQSERPGFRKIAGRVPAGCGMFIGNCDAVNPLGGMGKNSSRLSQPGYPEGRRLNATKHRNRHCMWNWLGDGSGIFHSSVTNHAGTG